MKMLSLMNLLIFNHSTTNTCTTYDKAAILIIFSGT